MMCVVFLHRNPTPPAWVCHSWSFTTWLHERHQQGRKLAAGGPGNRLFVPAASSFAACVSFDIFIITM